MKNFNSDVNITILLTGTIVPNTRKTLAISNPVERLEQYKKAIEFYLNETEFNIVFAENSDTEFPYYENRQRFEYVTFKSPNEKIDKGKGWKEYGILTYALLNSDFLQDTDLILKITGRLKLLNLNKIMNKRCLSKHQDLVVANYYRNKKMDSRCFLFSKSFSPYFNENAKAINVNYSFERALFMSIQSFSKKRSENKFIQFNEPLRIDGVSGGLGHTYNVTLFKFFLLKINHLRKEFHLYKLWLKN